jgi:hypothetical protein
MRAYPQFRLIRLDAIAAVGSWASFLVGALALIIGSGLSVFSIVEVDGSFVFFPCLAFFVLALVHCAASFLHRCPTCARHPTIQGFTPVHDSAKSSRGLEGWSRVVWDVFRKRPFRCIHCGDEYVARNAA